jgi:leader peptidase (prepilin peptidase)/N-methyltransferase
MDLPRPALLALAVLVGLALGPWLARASVRLAAPGAAGRPSPARTAITTAVLVLLLTGATVAAGARPALVALGWAAGAAVVLGAVDLAVHRIPDRVTYPAAGVCAAALVVDAAVTGSWDALVRALLAAAASGGVAALGWLVVRVFLGLVVGSIAAVVLLATGRAGWRTALPFGPPLLTGAAMAVALQLTGTLG